MSFTNLDKLMRLTSKSWHVCLYERAIRSINDTLNYLEDRSLRTASISSKRMFLYLSKIRRW